MEMDATYQTHLEDAQKKLSAFRSHLDLLVHGVWESKNVNETEILAAVNELQSLVEWAAHQPDLGPESAVLLVQLQELHRIRQNLENSKTKVENHGRLHSNEVAENILCKDEIFPKEHLDLCGIEPSNLGDSNETKNQENISAITSPNTSISHASESSENTDAHAIFVSDSDVADDIVECDGLDFQTEFKTSLNIEDNNECVKVTNVINDIEVKCLSSIKAELFVKTSEEKKSMDYSKIEAFKHVLKIEDTHLSNVEAADETVVETKCSDSNKYEILEKLETDEQNLPLCDTHIILKSDTQFKELVLSDFEMLPDRSIVVQNLLYSEAEVGVETNTMVLSGDAEVLAENTVVENLFSCDTEMGADSNSVVKNMLSSDTEMIETTCVWTQDFLRSGAEAVEISNVQAHDLFSGDNTFLTTNGIDIKNIHTRNTLSEIPKSLRKEVIILETNEDDKTTELIGDQTNDPLDVCMFAIRNLYDSLRAKENELLKLSVIQNDQKQIDALQKVIIDFHRKITNQNSELDKTKEENSLLKEQVLELEEAENDARLEAQKLEQKLVFLQEKDSHSQTEISQMKQNLKKNTETIAKKELTEKENRSQIKYLETLVQKYEDQIKLLETRQRTASKKQKDDEERRRRAEEAAEREKPFFSEKGTQTYPCQIKIDNNNGCLKVNSNNDKFGSDLSQIYHFQKEVTNKNAIENCSSDAKSVIEAADITEQCALDETDSITQKVLMERLCKLMSDDAGLQQEIHHVDQINLDLWKKLQNLENNIGECKRKDINETDPEVSSNDPCGSEENISVIKTIESNACVQANSIPHENLISLDQNEQLTKFEEMNISFVKELKTSNTICKEKKKKYSEWMDTEKRLLSELKEIADERDCLVSQVVKLKKEKEELEQRVFQQQAELNALKDKNQQEIVKIRTDQEEMARQLHHKVNQLIAKEKDLLKMITKLKSERSQDQDKSELERLKSNYIELQLELSNSREEIRKLEEGFQIRLDECVKRHLQEESRLTTELERLRNEKARCDKTINDLQLKQHNLLQSLERQEKELLLTRECYRKSLEQTEDVHRSVETELKSQLQKMEEVTVFATTAFTEERMRVEKELQDNIKDLKAKEELYKAKISELEEDVNNLHAELHKIAEEAQVQKYSAEKKTSDENESVPLASVINSMHNDTLPLIPSQVSEEGVKQDIASSAKPLNQPHAPETDSKSLILNSERDSQLLKKSQMPENDSKSPIYSSVNDTSVTVANKKQPVCGTQLEKQSTGENVNLLRVQVKELQAQLEEISGEVSPTQTGPAITAPCMGLQKEELDYAEVDECAANWRRATQNLPAAQNFQTQFQALYGDKYATGYRNNYLNKKPAVEEADDENDYDEILPRPTNFHVVQQVGPDTLLVGWNYVNPSVLDGFEVYLDDQVHERIYIPDRTKALISGLNLRKPIHLSICALSRYGQMSEPAVLVLSRHLEINSMGFENEDEDEYKDFEDPMNSNKRPYSMEW